jgi:hypothetical protein
VTAISGPASQDDSIAPSRPRQPIAASKQSIEWPTAQGLASRNRSQRRALPQRRLLWDGEKMEVTNDKEANSFVKRTYREGWSL